MSRENERLFDVRALEAFEAAMSCGSMTGAAKQLGIGQPAVTRLVRDLEENLGFQLFHRNGPRISPTDQGLRFHGEVQRILAGFRQIRGRADAIRDDRLPSLDIAATPTIAGGLMATALNALGPDMPDHVNLQTMNPEYVVHALHNGTADFGAAAYPLDHMGLEPQVLCESRLVAALPDTSPLVEKYAGGALPVAELAKARLITVGTAYRIRHQIDMALDHAGVRPAQVLFSNSSVNAMMAARAGLGIGIPDPVTAFGIPVQGVTILPLDVEIPYIWGLFTKAGRVLAPSQARLTEAFRTACIGTIPDCILHDPQDTELLRQIGQISRT